MERADFARPERTQGRALPVDAALTAEHEAERERDSERLISYERDPAQALAADERLRLGLREPARLAAADRHAAALRTEYEAEQRSRQAAQAERNRMEARELVGALRQAVKTCLGGLIGQLVAARQRGKLNANAARPLTQALARVLAQAVATRTNVPELAWAAQTLGTVAVRSTAFERIESDVGRMLERLEPLLTTRAGALGEPAFSGAIDAATLARSLCETALQVVEEAQRDTKHAHGGLPARLRAEMERSLGEDLGGVELHRESAVAGNAEAVTVGEEIHLGPGQDVDEGAAGKRVLGGGGAGWRGDAVRDAGE